VAQTDGAMLQISYTDPGGALHKEDFDIIVLSVGMRPSGDAVTLSGKLGIDLDDDGFPKTDSFYPINTTQPNIFVCGAAHSPKDIPLSVINARGADDYITKPFDMHELRVRVRAGQRIVQLQSELLETKKNLEIQSRTDPLTGVLNRRAILSQIENELSRAKRGNAHVSISMLDLDHFKKINRYLRSPCR